MAWCELASRPVELVLEGAVEELRKDKKMYQKMAKLHLRQPFQAFPPSLVLQETFTVDLLKGLYILQSRAGFHGDKEALHTLTIGHQSPSPFLCSALIHPFSSSILPPDSDVCLALFNNQTQKDIQGRLRIGSEDILAFFGKVHFNPLHSRHQEIQVQVNFTHQLQLRLPSSAIMQAGVCWTPKNNTGFDYQAKGKLKIEQQECQLSLQLNGTSSRFDLYSFLSHPFKSKIPKTLEAKATADVFTISGGGCSSVHLKADGKDRMTMDAQVFHSLQEGGAAVGLQMNVSQNLLPITTDLLVEMAANISLKSVSLHSSYKQGQETLLTQVKGSLQNVPGLQLAVSGDLRHSITKLAFLPSALGLAGALGKTDSLIEGELRVRVADTLYRVELRHQTDHKEEGQLKDKGNKEDKSLWIAYGWLCVWSGAENVCVNSSHRLGGQQRGEVYTQLSHNFHLLKAVGLPFNSGAKGSWAQHDGGLSAVAEIQSGAEHLKAEFNGSRARQWEFSARLQHQVKVLLKRGVSKLIQAKAHCQFELGGLNSGVTFIVEDDQVLDVILNVTSKNTTALLEVSLWQQVKFLKGVLPTSMQMNCTGDTTADRLSAQCYGNVAGHPMETLLPPQTSFNMSVSRSGCSTSGALILNARDVQKGSINVSLYCLPSVSFKASVQHSMAVLQMLGFPARGEMILNTAHLSGVEVGLELGNCYFRGYFGKRVKAEEYIVNTTSYCPALQETSLPVSVVVRGLLSVVPCQLTLSSAVSADDQALSLDLRQSCRPLHLSGTLSHSFTELRRRGLPHALTIEATTPWSPEHSGALLIRAGTCHLKAERVTQVGGRTQWIWALESECPLLEAHGNGSVWQDPQGMWVAIVETSLDGKRGSLRMNARAWPELRLEAEISQNLPALRRFPEHSRLRVTSETGKQQYNAEALIQMDDCIVRARGAAQHGLQGELVYNNNCTVIETWGGPDRIHASGSLVVTSALAKSQLFMAIDNSELQALVTLKNTKDKNEASLLLNHTVPFFKELGLPLNASVGMHSGSHGNGSHYFLLQSRAGNLKWHQEMSVSWMAEAVRVHSSCRHTVDYLEKLGVPENNSIQVELGSTEGKTLTLQSLFGRKQAGLSLKMNCGHLAKEVKAAVWHSWSWLQDRGVPATTEGLISIQGHLPQLHSKAQLTVDGCKLLSSALNVSAADGRLAVLLLYSSSASNQTEQKRLDTAVTAQFKGPLRSASVDVRSQDWRLLMMGDIGGWGGARGSKEARVTLKHTVHGQSNPALQVEAWGRLTESQLKCSMALNPELSSSLALVVQGHHLPHSKDLMLKVVQNIPRMLTYLPSHLNVRSQLNQSESSVASLVEVLSGRRRLWAFGELAALESGYRQAVELKHSYPQLKPLPRSVAVRTVCETRNWSYRVQHEAMWGTQEVSLNGLYTAPPALNIGNQTLKVQITCIPRWTSLDLTLEHFAHGRIDSLLLDWMRHGQMEQLKAVSSWSQAAEMNETKLELQQPFSSKLGRLSLHSLSQSSVREQRSSQKAHLLWDGLFPINVSLSLNQQWQDNSSRGQACAIFTSQQIAVSSVKGCLLAVQEGNSYSQNAELRWDGRSLKQGMKYQRGQRGIHSLQVNVWLDQVSSAPCPSHTLLAKIQTNLRDRLEHTLLLGICPPQPSLSWSGSHRLNSGEELFYTQSRLSVTQRPHQCSVTVALTNASSAHHTNISLLSETRLGNWSIEVGGSTLTWPQGSGIEIQAKLDRREKVWLNGSVTGRCLQTTAGYINAPGLNKDITVRACVAKDHSLTLDVKRKDGANELQSVGSVSVGTANQTLALKACGCLESFTAVEEQVDYLSSQVRSKLLERFKTVQHLLTDFSRQSRDNEFVQELSAMPLNVSQRLEALLLLGQTDRGLSALWQKSAARRFVTDGLPRSLSLLQHASLLGQQELRRPLATLAGVYQDVKGQKLDALWREAVSMWTQRLVEVLPGLIDNPQFQPLAQACITGLSIAVDVAGQQSYHWLENRLAMALSGVRKRLTSVYKFAPRECSVSVSVPLPQLHWPGTNEAELVQALLEEWLLKPLQTLASIRPTAELYRLKRKIMDSPFTHQALLVADQFVVTYDGHLFEVPHSCPLLLAQSVSTDPSFQLILNLNSQSHAFLLIELDNNNISIQHNGQVKANCHNVVTNTFYNDGVSVKRAAKVVEVSNQNGVSVSCDMSTEVCSLTVDGWLHGTSTGLMGTNDNEAGNDFLLPDGSQAKNLTTFLSSWQVIKKCVETPAATEHVPKAAISPVSCDDLFSSSNSPLSSCFRVVDPGQFLSVCERSSHRAPCRLASAFVYVCQQNYIPLEVPVQCCKSG